MFIVDGVKIPRADVVVGLDLSLTGPGLALIDEPWGRTDPVRPLAMTLERVPREEHQRGLVLEEAAQRVAGAAHTATSRRLHRVVCMEALLLQSGTGKAPERAAFWWMVRGELERLGFLVVTMHPTTRRSLALDLQARVDLRAMPEKQRKVRGKKVGLESVRRRWESVVIPDDNSADALVCAEVAARGMGWEGFPLLDGTREKVMAGAIEQLGIERKVEQ